MLDYSAIGLKLLWATNDKETLDLDDKTVQWGTWTNLHPAGKNTRRHLERSQDWKEALLVLVSLKIFRLNCGIWSP